MALGWKGDPIQSLELVLGLVSGMAGPARGPGLPKWIVISESTCLAKMSWF